MILQRVPNIYTLISLFLDNLKMITFGGGISSSKWNTLKTIKIILHSGLTGTDNGSLWRFMLISKSLYQRNRKACSEEKVHLNSTSDNTNFLFYSDVSFSGWSQILTAVSPNPFCPDRGHRLELFAGYTQTSSFGRIFLWLGIFQFFAQKVKLFDGLRYW